MNFGEQLTQATIESVQANKAAMLDILNDEMLEAAKSGKYETYYIPSTEKNKELFKDDSFLEELRAHFTGVVIERNKKQTGIFASQLSDCISFKWGTAAEAEGLDVEKE